MSDKASIPPNTFCLLSSSSFPHLDQRVLRLDISMEEAVLVHEGDSLRHLKHDIANLLFGKGSTSLAKNGEREIRGAVVKYCFHIAAGHL